MDSRMRYRSQHNDHMLGHSLHYHHHNNNNSVRVGQLYTMCGSHQQQASGAQLLMNSPSVATATQFQFIPGRRNFTTSAPLGSHNSSSAACDEADSTMPSGLFTVMPFINSIKGFFTNLMRPKGGSEPCSLDNSHREFNSVPNIYMNLMSKNSTSTKCEMPHSNDIDFELFDAQTLSASTKSFSDNDLRMNAEEELHEIMADAEPSVPKFTLPQQQTSIAIPATVPQIAKDIQTDSMGQMTSLQSPLPTIKLSGRRHKKNKRINKHRIQSPAANATEGMSQSPQRTASTVVTSTATCTLLNSHHKKPAKTATKNKKEKIRHELAWNIHEDIEDDDRCVPDEDTVDFARIENIPSVQPASQCIISAAFTCFTAKDFPAIRKNTKASSVLTSHKHPLPRQFPTTPPPSPTPPRTITKSSCSWEIPIRSPSCLGPASKARSAALRARLAACPNRQRQISECDTEDNFIVFSNGVHIENEVSLASSLESTLSFCDRIRNHFAENGRRSRRFSESSDDFICFELEDDEDEDDIDGDNDDATSWEESDSEDDTLEEQLIYAISDEDGDDDDVKSVETNQLDSGFEEKKVSITINFHL